MTDPKEKDKDAARRKKRGLLPLDEKMGLDRTTEYRAPAAPPSDLTRPGMFPNAAPAALEARPEAVSEKFKSKIRDRRSV